MTNPTETKEQKDRSRRFWEDMIKNEEYMGKVLSPESVMKTYKIIMDNIEYRGKK